MKLRLVARGRFAWGVLMMATLVLWIGCGGEPDTSGRLVIIGGGLRAENTAVYQAVLDGRMGDGPLCVFPTASAEPQSSMESAMERFDAVGGPGTSQGIYLTVDNPADAYLDETVANIEACSGFYFVGGVQTRIVQVFRPDSGESPAYRALMDRFAAGAVVSGSSAGAAIMNDPMIGGGSSEGALTEGIRGPDQEGEGVILEKGMGFLGNTLVDQHVLARGRWARSLVAILETEAFTFGAAIDENTALAVQGDSAWVVGASGVVFYDTRQAVRADDARGVSGVVVYLLGPGEGVNLSTGAVHFDPGKSPLATSEESPDLTSLDLFERWNFLHFLAGSATSPDSTFTFTQAGFTFEFRKGEGYRARAREGEGVQGVPAGLSAGPLLLCFASASEP